MPTIADIARLANCSVGQVSYVLNGKYNPNKPKHVKIIEIAKELNFVPNRTAGALASGKTNTISLIVSGDLHSTMYEKFFMDALFAITAKLSQRGMGLILNATGNTSEWELTRQILGGVSDGILWYFKPIPDGIKRVIEEHNIPCVLMLDEDEEMDFLTIDDYGAVTKALMYLRSLGHERIAFLGNDIGPRYRAYQAFTQAHQRSYYTQIQADQNEFKTLEALRRHRAEHGIDYTAIFCERDVLAITALIELQRQGVAVPERVSVVGYDDLPIAAQSVPPLTTVHHNIEEIVDLAVELLMEKLEHPTGEKIQRVFEHELVCRASTALAPQNLIF